MKRNRGAVNISSTESKTAGIDLLRGIAALGVLIVHLSQSYSNIPVIDAISPTLDMGKHGVAVFFTLSGYLLTRSFWNNPNLKSYAVSRVRRIYPAYIFCVLILVYIHPVGYFQILTHVLLIHFITAESFGSINYPFWSLSIEFVYYLLLPCLHKIRNRRLFRTLYLGIFFSLIWQVTGGLARKNYNFDQDLDYVAALYPLTGFSAFALGMMYALNSKNIWTTKTARCSSISILSLELTSSVITSFAVASPFYTYLEMMMHGSFGYLIYGIFTLLLIEKASKIKSKFWKPFVALGGISYSLYLWHLPAIHFTRSIFGNGIVSLLFSMLASIALASLSYKSLEKPFLKNRSKPIL